MEEWKIVAIPGFENHLVSKDGIVKRTDGRVLVRNTRNQYGAIKNNDYYIVLRNGKKKMEIKVIAVMARTFLGMPENHYAFTKDGNPDNTTLENVDWKTKEEMRRMQNVVCFRSKHPCLKIDKDGNVLAEYESISKAALYENLDKLTIINQCNGKAKNALGEISFCYKDDKQSFERSIKRFSDPDDWRRKKCK